MWNNEKHKEKQIHNNLKMRASQDRKKSNNLLKRSRIRKEILFRQRKMHLMWYLESEIDQLLSITIWHLQLITFKNVLENRKSLQSLLILQLHYLYQLNENKIISFIFIFGYLLIWSLIIPIMHFVELLNTYKFAIGIQIGITD